MEFIPLNAGEIAKYEQEAPPYQPVTRTRTAAGYRRDGDGVFRRDGLTCEEISVICAGDMLCEQNMYKTHVRDGRADFHDVFQFVRPILAGGDLTIGNLETTICESSPYTGEQYKIDGKYHCNAPVEFLKAIRHAGFDFLAMSNNHNCDSGVNGLLETINHVDEQGFMRTGVFTPEEKQRFTLVEVKGVRIAVLSYSTWFNRNENRFTKAGRDQILNVYSAERAAHDIRAAKFAGAEFVLVYMHWGIDAEYKNEPSVSMRRMAQNLADVGADCIIGSHTHSVQSQEMLYTADGRKVFCIYSMGNFVTSEMAKISRETAVLDLRLRRRHGRVVVYNAFTIPCYIPDRAFGAAYPILPETCLPEREEMIKEFKQIYHKIRNIMGDAFSGAEFLTTANLCGILGITTKLENRRYTTLNFAQDARKDGVAVVSAITSNPTYKTPEKKQLELADEAMMKGAALLISTRQIKNYPCLIVDDVFAAYCKVVTACRDQFDPKTISITGSIGKTTTTEMVYTVLSSKYNTHRNTGSANSVRYAGTVVQGLKKEHQVYVQETMEGPPYGTASTIAKMVKPSAAIVTVVGTSHLEIFGTQERILESCLGVQDGMPDDGLLILNGDDPFQRDAKPRLRAVYYGVDNEAADYRAVNIRGEGQVLAFDILHDDSVTPAKIHCFGKHNVLDALAAFAAGKWAGMTDAEAAAGLEKYRTSGIRQNLVKYGGYRLYLDCYNAAPESMKSAFDALAMVYVPEGGRRIGVLGDVLETGEQEKEFHQLIGRMAAESCLDAVFCYGKCAALIAEEVRAKGNIPVWHTTDPTELVRLLRENVTSKDLTLFKGSHGMELEHIVDMTWGTWFHEEFERYDFKTRVVSDTDLRYQVYTDHVAVIDKISSAADITIPERVEGLPVTSLSTRVFNASQNLTSIRLPDTLVNIRHCAFYKANRLQTVKIPASVRIIDASAFSTCENLNTVTIEEGCTHLGYRAFGNCKNLERIIIPASVKQIESEAFRNCSKLTICGEEGSYAEGYAKSQNIPFVATKLTLDKE